MSNTAATRIVSTLFRIVLGLLLGLHGAAALFGILGGSMGSGQAAPIGLWPDWWAAGIQFIGGTLVLLGLATRPAAIICSGAMAYAYFSVHQQAALLPMHNGGELAALFSWSYLMIAVLGPGQFALDALLKRRSAPAVAVAPAPVEPESVLVG